MDPSEKSDSTHHRIVPTVKTVQCVHCGLHLPEVEAISSPHGFYCCREHQQLGLPDESRQSS